MVWLDHLSSSQGEKMVWLDRTVYVTIGYLCSRVQEPLKGTFLEVVSPEGVDE